MKNPINPLLLLSCVLCAQPISAQNLHRIQRAATAVNVEYSTVQFANSSSGITLTSSGWQVSGWFRVGESGIVTVDVPYYTTTIEFDLSGFGFSFADKTTETAIGNLAVGFLSGAPDATMLGEVQVVLPTISREKSPAGTGLGIGDPLHLERYAPEVLVLNGGLRYRARNENGFTPSFHGGTSVWVKTSSDPGGGQVELFLDYGAGLGYVTSGVGFFAGVDGRLILTEDNFLAPGKRTVHMVTLEADIILSGVRPSVFYRIPLNDEVSSVVSSVIGLSVGVIL